jgi:urease beta subunit
VRLIPIAGGREVWGFNGQVMGSLDGPRPEQEE